MGCNVDKKDVIDSFRKIKLLYNPARFKLHSSHVEDLNKNYEILMKVGEEIQAKNFSNHDELLKEDLIECELDACIFISLC